MTSPSKLPLRPLPPRPPAPQGDPEARLERDVLRAIADTPDVWMHRNEVGVGYPRRVGDMIEVVLLGAGVGDATRALVARILARNRITYGLGVGSPDLFGDVAGIACGVELKSPAGVVSPEQTQWHEAARSRGVAVGVVRSVAEFWAFVDSVRSRARR